MLPMAAVVYVLSVGEPPWYWCRNSNVNGCYWSQYAHDVRGCARRCNWNVIVRA